MRPAAGSGAGWAARTLASPPAALLLLLAATGCGAPSTSNTDDSAPGAGANKAPMPSGLEKAADAGDPITVQGTVISAWPGYFILDHGAGRMKVEVDDRRSLYREGAMLRKGDRVIVSGRVDEGLYLPPSIEAARVYVPALGLSVFASPADEENRGSANHPASVIDITGKVERQDETRLFVRTAGKRAIVDTSALPQRLAQITRSISPGDQIYAWGEVDADRLVARGIAKLSPQRPK